MHSGEVMAVVPPPPAGPPPPRPMSSPTFLGRTLSMGLTEYPLIFLDVHRIDPTSVLRSSIRAPYASAEIQYAYAPQIGTPLDGGGGGGARRGGGSLPARFRASVAVPAADSCPASLLPLPPSGGRPVPP